MRALKITGAAIAAVIAIMALLLVVGIPSGFLTSAVQARIERETGYRMTVAGTTKISLWPSLNVTLNDLTLQDPKDRDASRRLTIGSVEADMTLSSAWSGHPQITELVITRPVMYLPLLRERTGMPGPASNPSPGPAASAGEPDAKALRVDRIKVTDGAIVLSNLRDRVEERIDGVSADVRIDGPTVTVSGNARASGHPLKFDIKATAPAFPVQRQNIPVDLKLDAPELLQNPLAARAEVRLNGSVVMINGLTGSFGDGAFNGWASVDLASKPLVKLDLDFQRLDLAVPSGQAASASQNPDSPSLGPPSWSNASINVIGLNYVDVQARVSAADLNIGTAHFAPAAIDTALAGGVLRVAFQNLGAYGGQASGQLIVDASAGEPVYSLQCDLSGVRALPLLRSAAGFDKLDGKLQTKIIARSTGASQRAIMSNMSGTVFAVFQDGAIRGLNVARMIRSLTTGTLSGWQETKEQTTDLAQLSASFHVEKGQATTSDLNLVGPLVKMTGAGTVDLGTRMLAFRVEPKLVMTTEGQGRAADPVGLGIPVVIEGPWAEPRIYPEISGILDNPDAAYAKLKEMGKGLFGGDSGDSGGLSGQLGSTLENLLQQGLGQGRSLPSQTPASPAPPPSTQSTPPPTAPDSQPMNDVLRQLFNR